MNTHKKNAQHLAFTTLFFIFLFFLLITLFINQIFTTPQQNDQTYRLLEREADRAIATLTGPGYPPDWNKTTVQRIGLTTNHHYNKTKEQLLTTIITSTDDGYFRTKEHLGIRNNYLLQINEQNGNQHLIPSTITLNDFLKEDHAYLITRKAIIPDKKNNLITITLYLYRDQP